MCIDVVLACGMSVENVSGVCELRAMCAGMIRVWGVCVLGLQCVVCVSTVRVSWNEGKWMVWGCCVCVWYAWYADGGICNVYAICVVCVWCAVCVACMVYVTWGQWGTWVCQGLSIVFVLWL